MQAGKTQRSCDSVRLDVLLATDEDSAEFRGTAAHVEACASCQDRLANLAGSDADWGEARGALRRDDLDRERPVDESLGDLHPRLGETRPRAAAGQDRRPQRLDFLAPPSHPEMLGRLGRYEIESVIGAGGMGIVLKGFDTELNRPVAIKVLAPHLAHSGAARQRFAREARAAAAVVHEHVVAIHNVESDGVEPDGIESGRDVPFLVMQYVPGRSLADRVEQDGPLEPAEILRIGSQAAAGLAAAHAQGVIHRDIKPANILLENDVERVLLTDFGLARAAEDASLTRSGIIAGTPHYMSPEQARGEAVDARSDLFSLGAVLYFMATGHPPFRAEQAMAVLHRICHDRHRPVWECNPRITDDLADVIDRLLEKKPSRRFATATDVQAALAGALSRLQQPQRWRSARWIRRVRRRRWQVSAAAGVVAAAAVSVWFWPGTHPKRSQAESPDAQGTGAAGRAPRTRAGATGAASGQSSPHAPREVIISRSEMTTLTNEFATELADMNQSLRGLAARPYPETTLLQQFGDPWSQELQAIDAQAVQMEKSWSGGPEGRLFFGTSKGEGR
jgi:hypothetical protein